MKIKFDLKDDEKAFFPKSASEKINKATKNALKVLVYLACGAKDGEADVEPNEIADKLMLREAEVNTAMAFWCGAGVLDLPEYEEERKKTPDVKNDRGEEKSEEKKLVSATGAPEYTSDEIGKMLEKNRKLRILVDETQKRLGKMLGVREVSVLLGIKEHLNLDDEYIYLLIEFCAGKDGKSMRYIETTAYTLYDKDVRTPGDLQRYIKQMEEYASLEGKFRTLIGARSRSLSPKEAKFVNEWMVEKKYDPDMIGLAYETAVDKTGTYSLSYMNRILENWYLKKIYTVEAAAEQKEKFRKGKRGREASRGESSFDVNDFLETALGRSYPDEREK